MERMRRTLTLVTVALLTLGQAGLAGVARFHRSATEHDVEAERATTASYAMQLAAAVDRPANGTALTPQSRLLATPDVAGTLQVIQETSDAAGVTALTAKALQSSTAGRQSFLIVGRGKPEHICAFVAGLEQHERLMVIENGKCTPGSADELQFELGLATYHSGGVK